MGADDHPVTHDGWCHLQQAKQQSHLEEEEVEGGGRGGVEATLLFEVDDLWVWDAPGDWTDFGDCPGDSVFGLKFEWGAGRFVFSWAPLTERGELLSPSGCLHKTKQQIFWLVLAQHVIFKHSH